MTSEKAKLAYVLFFGCITLWSALILSVCLPSGRWTAPIQFPNFFTLTLFVASAVLSSITAMVIGLNFLGINFKTHRLKQNSGYVLPLMRIPTHTLRLEPSSKDSANKSEPEKTQNLVADKEENSICKSTGKDWSETEQTATTCDASVKTKDRQKSMKRTKHRQKNVTSTRRIEVKTGSAKLSPLQNKMKKKKRTKVEIIETPFL